MALSARASSSADLLTAAMAALSAAGIENPRLDAELLLAEASHSSRTAIVSGAARIDAAARRCYSLMVGRRAQREPLAYIVGRKEFYSLSFEVNPAVLIPRPETETIVSAALQLVGSRACRMLDLGTGAGTIALAIAAHAPGTELTATDISAAALTIARRNARHLGLAERVRWRQADCFTPTDGDSPLGRFDLIVSNPPYVESRKIDQLEPEISRYEPRLALAGGTDGLEVYRRIAAGLRGHLETGGTVLLEIGAAQRDPVMELLHEAGAAGVKVLSDLAGLPRVVIALF